MNILGYAAVLAFVILAMWGLWKLPPKFRTGAGKAKYIRSQAQHRARR